MRYRVTPKKIHAHLFSVELTLDNPNPLGQVFALPNWIPGSYLIRDFAKQVITIEASSCGNAIPINQLDKNHWIAYPCESSITLVYEIYAFDLSVRSAYLSSERAFFNGSSLFLLPLGFEHEKCQVELLNFTAKIACALNEKNGRYHAQNYQTLIDSPVEIADFDSTEFKLNGVDHQIIITGKHHANLTEISQDIEKICTHHLDFFGELPFEKYVFLTLATAQSYGGLEHKNSCALICSRDELLSQNKKKYARFLALVAHEYFHAWWIKTIKPASFHNLDLNHENHTEQLWIYEGFTSYYDELSLLRTEILTPEQYLTLFAQNITRVQKSTGRFKQSLAQSSFETWTKFYQQDENAPNAIVSYYSKGALLAFVLDIEIRKATQDKKTLDDVLKVIWRKYQTTGTENNSVQIEVEKITRENFDEFFANYLYDTKELPLKTAFDYVGIDCCFTYKQDDLSDFGINFNQDLKITTVFADSCAEHAGLYTGDKIVSIDGVAVESKNLAQCLAKTADQKVLKVGLFRDNLFIEVLVVYQLLKPTFCTLNIKQNLSEKTLNQQNKWFYQQKIAINKVRPLH